MFPLCRRPIDVPVSNINIERITMEAQQCVRSSTVIKLEYFIMLTPLQLFIPDEVSDVMATSRRWQQRQYLDIHVHAPNSWPIWNKLEFSRQSCIKVLKIKFHENPSSRSRTDTRRTDRQTDRHDEANRRFSRLMLNAPKRLPWPSLGSWRFTPVQPYQWSSSCSEILLFEEKVSLSTVQAIKRCCSHQNLALTALCSNRCHMFCRNTSVWEVTSAKLNCTNPIHGIIITILSFDNFSAFAVLRVQQEVYTYTDLDSLWKDEKAT